jgi:hypothetical protein
MLEAIGYIAAGVMTLALLLWAAGLLVVRWNAAWRAESEREINDMLEKAERPEVEER